MLKLHEDIISAAGDVLDASYLFSDMVSNPDIYTDLDIRFVIEMAIERLEAKLRLIGEGE